jgi:hypothetical protein
MSCCESTSKAQFTSGLNSTGMHTIKPGTCGLGAHCFEETKEVQAVTPASKMTGMDAIICKTGFSAAHCAEETKQEPVVLDQELEDLLSWKECNMAAPYFSSEPARHSVFHLGFSWLNGA